MNNALNGILHVGQWVVALATEGLASFTAFSSGNITGGLEDLGTLAGWLLFAVGIHKVLIPGVVDGTKGPSL